jgi:large subunit ribosomal protein L2
MKKIKVILAKRSGRSYGKITVRHQGGRQKRYLREIDFKRDKRDIWATVSKIEYDPNRNAEVALLVYEDGEKRYITAPDGLKLDKKVIASEAAPLEPGNALPLAKIPAGTLVNSIEITPGKGAQIARGAGTACVIQGREGEYVLVKLPSTEIRRFKPECYATIGQIGRIEARTENVGKAGRNRNRGIRPTVRGVAMHPAAHPHGGGEGRSSVGLKYPKTPYGKPAVGKTRNKYKHSNKLIVQKRKPGKHGART